MKWPWVSRRAYDNLEEAHERLQERYVFEHDEAYRMERDPLFEKKVEEAAKTAIIATNNVWYEKMALASKHWEKLFHDAGLEVPH